MNTRDWLDIVDLVTHADDLATARDADGYAELYEPDGRMDGAEGTATGRDEIRTAVIAVWAAEPAGTRHLTTTIRVHPGATVDDAIATSTLLLVTAEPPALVAVVPVRQTVHRTADGWAIRERSIG